MSSHFGLRLARIFTQVCRLRPLRRQRSRRPGIETLEARLMLTVAPIAEAGSARSMAALQTITLSAAGSTDSDGTIVAYDWDLDGDGQYDDATGISADFSATSAGRFAVGLKVTDNNGQTGTDTTTVVAYDTNTGGRFEGYNLFVLQNTTTVYLMDNDGNIVHSWAVQYPPGNAIYLLENGMLLYNGKDNNSTFNVGGKGGIVQMIDWDGNVTWEYSYSSTEFLQHHDVEILPNGNVLMVAWQRKTGADAIAAGRNPGLLAEGELWPDSVIEVEPTGSSGGNIVWEWHSWDHMIQDYDPTKPNHGIVSEHPELIDLNYTSDPDADWHHVNAVDYNADLDQIVLSVHHFSEIWVIDHSTTKEEASGHTDGRSGKGGDLLYRWGNAQTYDAGTATDQQLFVQHNPEWIEDGLPGEGNLLIFNNGMGRPGGNYSSVDEIVTPVNTDGSYTHIPDSAYGPNDAIWKYTANAPADFYASFISGSQRLPNGNTLIVNGPDSYYFEVTATGEKVWEYDTTGRTFRVRRYAPEYSGFDGTPLDDAVLRAPKITGPAATVTQQAPRITWTAVPIATSYNIYLQNLSTNKTPYHRGTATTNSYTPPTELGVGQFRVWVQAVNGDLKGPWSTPATFHINTQVVLAPIPQFQTGPTPTFTWNALPGAATYDLWIDNQSAGTRQFVRAENLTSTSWTAPANWPIGHYRVWVRAKDAAGIGARWSAMQELYLVTQPDVIGPLSSTFDRTPEFSWNPLAGAVKYEVFLRNQNTGTTTIYQRNISNTSWAPATDLPEGPYRWWAIGISAENFRSQWTNHIDFFIVGRPEIVGPSGNVSNATPTLTWKPVEGAISYELFVDRIGIQYHFLNKTNLAESSYTPEIAMPKSNYRFWIRAFNSAGETSFWSLPMSFTIV